MNTRSRGLFATLVSLFLTACAAAVPITGPAVIDVPGSYELAGDLVANTSPFITISAKNVVIDGNGFSISAAEGTGGDALLIRAPGASPVQNVTVRDLVVRGWDVGIHAKGVNGGVIRNVTSSSPTENGIWLSGSRGFIVNGCTVSGSGLPGIALDNSSGNTLTWNTVTGSSDAGVYLVTSHQNRLFRNTLADNRYNGIYLDNSTGNKVSENSAGDNEYPGIALEYSDKNTLGRNYLSGNSISQIYLDNATGNRVLGNFGRGTAVMSVTSGKSGLNLIRDNIDKRWS